MRALIFISLLAASTVTAIGCHPKPAEGPAERAGKSVDNAADKTKDAAKDAAKKVENK